MHFAAVNLIQNAKLPRSYISLSKVQSEDTAQKTMTLEVNKKDQIRSGNCYVPCGLLSHMHSHEPKLNLGICSYSD